MKLFCKQILLFFLIGILSVSCASSKKIRYFQDELIGTTQLTSVGEDITLKSGDQISIVVSSKDPELAVAFNSPRISQLITGGQSSGGNELMSYTVTNRGDIDFPILGSLFVKGLSRMQVAGLIKERLEKEGLLKDAIVTVNYANLTYSVLGEVVKPGKYNIDKDKTTILEALSAAGDLTIYGERDKIFLIRNVGDTRTTYQMNIQSTEIFNSPAYHVQQNDIIYVEPNKMRANQSTVNGNSARSVSIWLSIVSVLTTLGVIIFN